MRKSTSSISNGGSLKASICLILLLVSGGCLSGEREGKERLTFEVYLGEKQATFILINDSHETADVAYPFPLLFDEMGGGIELVFKATSPGAKKINRLCAMIDGGAERIPFSRPLIPGGVIGERISLEDLRKSHCLDYGAYEMTASYHNVLHGKQLGEDPKSVTLDIVFKK